MNFLIEKYFCKSQDPVPFKGKLKSQLCRTKYKDADMTRSKILYTRLVIAVLCFKDKGKKRQKR